MCLCKAAACTVTPPRQHKGAHPQVRRTHVEHAEPDIRVCRPMGAKAFKTEVIGAPLCARPCGSTVVSRYIRYA